MTNTQTNLDTLIAATRLGGRIDLLMELREWLDEKIADAKRENERLDHERLTNAGAQQRCEQKGQR